MKRRIRLSESDLHRVIKESVKNVIREWEETDSSPSAYFDETTAYVIIGGQYNLPIGVFDTSEDAASYLISRIMGTQEAMYGDSDNEAEKRVYEQIEQTKDEYGQWLYKYGGKKYECRITKYCTRN